MSVRQPFLKYLLPLLMALPALPAWSADTNPTVPATAATSLKKHLLANAVRVQITPRGMTSFGNQLSGILGNLGIKLDEGYFPPMNYTFSAPINMDDYTASNPDAVKMYDQVRTLLTKWLVGFSLNNSLPTIQIGDSGYVAKFSRFALVTDPATMKALGKTDGAVLAIEMDVTSLTLSVSSVQAWDMNNTFLGKVGFNDVTFQAGSEQVPLKIRLPFYIRGNANGGIDFEALTLSQNIEQIPLSFQYKQMIVPTYSIVVNGKQFNLNTDELKTVFDQNTPMILDKVRSSISDFAEKQLPALLNEKAQQYLSGALEQVQDMSPPGQDATDTRPEFKWGLTLGNKSITLNNYLNIYLTAFVEDTTNPNSAPVASNGSRGNPNMTALPAQNYDLALSVDRSLINRVLELSFQRKLFEQIKMTDGSSLKLTATPLIDYVKPPAGVKITPQETFIKMRVSVEQQPDSFWLKQTIILSFDIIAKLRQLPDKSGLQIVLYKIDEYSMAMDDSYLSLAGRVVKSKVIEGIQAKLKATCAPWLTKEQTIPGSLPLPPQILGLKLDINQMMMDPNGFIVMFLNYATGTTSGSNGVTK